MSFLSNDKAKENFDSASDQRQKKVADIYAGQIAVSNQLAESAFRLDKNCNRLINFSLAQVRSGESSNGIVVISSIDYALLYGMTVRAAHCAVKEAIETLQDQWIVAMDDKGEHKIRFRWLEAVAETTQDLPEGKDYIAIRFSQTVYPFLFELSQNFTRVKMQEANRLQNWFSFKLYQYLLAKGKGQVGTNKKNCTPPLDFLRALTPSKNLKWHNIERDYIKPAIELINKVASYDLKYEPIKAGRGIVAVNFYWSGKEQIPGMIPIRGKLNRATNETKSDPAKMMAHNQANAEILAEYITQMCDLGLMSKVTMKDLKKYRELCELSETKPIQIVNNEIGLRTKK